MFQEIVNYFTSINPIMAAGIATVFTWLMTLVGASIVFLFVKINRTVMDGTLGFTGGVMMAASVFGLLIPAMNMSNGEGFEKAFPAAIGFVFGALFLFILDKFLPHLHVNFKQVEGVKTPWQRATLMVMAITLHNIPEGLAIGVLFGGVAAGIPEATITGATILTIGIAIQNIPEGIAVTMPLRRLGLSKRRSFFYGQSSAIVEPIAGVIGALAVSFFTPILPYALAFAAGAMVFVVIEEVIPETQQANNTDIATLGFILGFVLMMLLDVGLGAE
jgi:ZIP family zinc transporter